MKDRAKGNALKGIGISLLITGFLLGMSRLVPYGEMNAVDVPPVIIFLSSIMIIGGALFFWCGRQYAAKTIAARVTGDSKPHVLYLRPFETDPTALRYVFSSISSIFALPNLMSGMLTEEDQLGEALQPFGNLVAIGKPGETLPTPGAARLYASDAKWKKVVTDQMQTARLVVIRAGSGEGLLWELRQAVQVLNPKQLLILMLNMKKKHYETFRKEAEQIFGDAFPKADDIRRFGRVSGFIRFSANWKSNFLPLRIPYFRSSVYKQYWRLFKFTLRPVFEEYDLDWQSPQVSLLTVLLVGFGLLILLVISILIWHFPSVSMLTVPLVGFGLLILLYFAISIWQSPPISGLMLIALLVGFNLLILLASSFLHSRIQ